MSSPLAQHALRPAHREPQRSQRRAHRSACAQRARPRAPAAAADGAQPAAPPYTSLSVPVLSLATAAGEPSGRASMNVVTYAAPVTIHPKARCSRYTVALYHGTQTLLNVQATGRGVMQILGAQHAHLMPLLGKTRGQDVDKLHELQAVHGMRLLERFGCMTLADCAGAFELTVVQSHDCGDHLLLVCDVGDATPAMLACEALTTGELRARGII